MTLAAVACCFFAALDEPAPQVFAFFSATCVSVVLAALYLFVVLPHVHDFAMLVVMFAVPFLIIGTLIPRPQFNLVTMLVAVNTATFISIQSAYEANFLTFINSNLAGLGGPAVRVHVDPRDTPVRRRTRGRAPACARAGTTSC